MTDLGWAWLKKSTIVVMIVLGLVSFGSTRPASAHAMLMSSSPSDQSILSTSPATVSLRFSEDVGLPPGSLRVFDGSGTRVDLGNARHGKSGSEVLVGVKSGLARGSYAVAWKVLSADSHPIHGGFVFSVGATSSVQGASKLLTGPSDRGWVATGDVLRGLAYFWSFVAVGGAIFLAFIGDEIDRRKDVLVGMTCAAVAAVVLTVAQVPVQAALATGLGASSLFTKGVLAQVLGEGFMWTQIGVAVAAMCALASMHFSRTTVGRALAVVSVAVLAGAFVLTGHTRTMHPLWLTILADAIHVMAGTVWVGGLILAGWSLYHRYRDPESDPRAAASMITRFSGLATVAVIAVGISGLVLAFQGVGSIHGMISTTYGRLVLAKIGVLFLISLAAAFNHFRLMPAIQSKPDRRDAWRYLERAMRIEAVGMLVILGVTGVLVNSVPARTVAEQQAVFSGTAPLGKGSVNLVIQPATTGPVQFHLYLLDASGRVDDNQQSVKVGLSLPSHDIGPIDRPLSKVGPGHYQANGQLFTLPGKWTVLIKVRVDDFTENVATFKVSVHG